MNTFYIPEYQRMNYMRNNSQPWICIRLTLSHADCRPDIGSALGSMLQESLQLLHNLLLL